MVGKEECDSLKKNKRGFVLVETLVVSVFIMGIFTYLYTQVIPLSGEFEKRQSYDDLDTTYVLFQTRKLLKQANFTAWPRSGYVCYTSSNFPSAVKSYLTESGVTRLCLTSYQLSDTVKSNLIKSSESSDRAWQEYIDYLPNFNYANAEDYNTFYSGYHRLLIEMTSPFYSPVYGNTNNDPGVRFGNLEVDW